MATEQPIRCCDCGREMAIYDCVDFCDDACAQRADHTCAPDQHSCCMGQPATDNPPFEYDPEFNPSLGMWIHDFFDCKDDFSIIYYPPQCAWRAVSAQVEQLYEDIKEGDFILVGYDGICERWMPDKEVEWALRKEQDGWSYHAFFGLEGLHGYLKYTYKPVFHQRELPFSPIQCMGPVAPRIYPLATRFVFHPVLQLKLHDPFQLIGMTEDGRFPGTFPAHIRIASPEFWKYVIYEITWSMEAYDNPKSGDVVRITEAEYTFRSHDLPVTVRYLAEYDGAKWHPMMTIQHKGREFIGYTHDWCEVDPVNPPPAI